jgi:molecular chaperone DnaK
LEAIDKATTELNTVFQAASQEMYNASQAQEPGGQAQPGAEQPGQEAGKGGDDEVTDVDFEEVK